MALDGESARRINHSVNVGEEVSTVADRFDPRSNALNLIRFLLAALVIVSHSFPVGGLGEEPHFGDITLGTVAVGGFFSISGYLITKSRASTPLLRFGIRRALRIFPGLWVCVALTGIIFSLIVGQLRGGWSFAKGVSYALTNGTFYHFEHTVGSTLAGAPFPAAWNGSLWTLRYELACYAVVGLLYLRRCSGADVGQ